ncbi:MAG: hypothetical protein IT282_16710, partial [Bacteroidetes bacterium]|nr:hypothetical protein [Bacteroidota bacterium]
TDSGLTAPAYGTFAFSQEVRLAGRPGDVFDAITGDISGWWDHSMSAKPYKLYIEAKPGGGFYEIFSNRGDGVLHATVTYAERGKRLRFVGPLGLAGKALDLVSTYDFAALGEDSTALTLTVRAAGEMEEGTGKLVRQVWHHFLVERFKPYFEGRHQAPPSKTSH